MKFKSLKEKGLYAEQLVVEYLKKRGWTILFQNKKFFSVEVDILAKKKQLCRLIEVKSITREEQIEKIFKVNQKERLKKVAWSLSEDFPNGVQLFLALVKFKKEIIFFKID